MTSIIFVHGTGGRSRDYALTYEQIESALREHGSNAKLYPCLWGDDYGTKLNAGGVSIPSYDMTGGKSKSIDSQNSQLLLWEDLYRDPLYEILLLSLKPTTTRVISAPGKLSPSNEFKNRVNDLDILKNTKLKDEIGITGFTDIFTKSHQIVTKSTRFSRLLDKIVSSPLDEYYSAVARAIVAQSIYMLKDEGRYAPILYNSDLRDRITDVIYRELTQDKESKGIGDWIKNQIYQGFVRLGDSHLQRQRGNVTDGAYPFAGDILLYQARGSAIREFIHTQVKQAEPPVVLLAHSLGGIACVDLLVEKKIPVELLITVGSQSPFLYEIGALQSLPYGDPLPKLFPKWLNIYDLRDILSYVGNQEGLFLDRISDILVDNKQPFPEAHSAYWSNSAVWEKIVKELP
jgi:hypothetical protein